MIESCQTDKPYNVFGFHQKDKRNETARSDQRLTTRASTRDGNRGGRLSGVDNGLDGYREMDGYRGRHIREVEKCRNGLKPVATIA